MVNLLFKKMKKYFARSFLVVVNPKLTYSTYTHNSDRFHTYRVINSFLISIPVADEIANEGRLTSSDLIAQFLHHFPSKLVIIYSVTIFCFLFLSSAVFLGYKVYNLFPGIPCQISVNIEHFNYQHSHRISIIPF